MDEVKYNGFGLGKATKIIAKTMKVISMILMIIILVFYLDDKKMDAHGNIVFARGLFDVLACVLIGYVFYRLLKKLFNPLIKLHENTILFTTHAVNNDFYKKKRKNSLIASIIFSILFFIPTLTLSLWAMILHWIFLKKTRYLLMREENENNISQDERKEVKQSDTTNTMKNAANISNKKLSSKKIIVISIIAICLFGVIFGLYLHYDYDNEVTYHTENITVYDKDEFAGHDKYWGTRYGKYLDIEIRSKYDKRGNKIEAYHYVLPEKRLKSKHTYKYDRNKNLVKEFEYLPDSKLKSINTYKYNSKGVKIEHCNFDVRNDYYAGRETKILTITKYDGDGYVIETKTEYYGVTEEGLRKVFKNNYDITIE